MVSVCIPTYNRAADVARAITSAQQQTYRDLEILVVDNHSTDDTPSVVAGLAARDPRIRFVRHAENLGLARNFSACIAEARRDYIKFLCDDDWLHPDCVARLVGAMGPGVALAACARQLVNEAHQPIRVAGARRSSGLIGGEAMMRELFARGNVIGEPTAVLFRKSDAARGFDVRYEHALDLEMWCHLLHRGSLAFVAEPLCSVRVHAAQATKANLQAGRILEDKQRLFRELQPADLSRGERLLWDLRMASSVGRMRAAGAATYTGGISEVFHPRLFRGAMVPLARLAWSVAR